MISGLGPTVAHNPYDGVNILIAHPSPEFRQAMAALLREDIDVGMLREAGNGADALCLLHADVWDVAILGVHLPVGGGRPLLQQFKAERPSLPVVMVRRAPDPIAVRPALDAGACGYVMADALPQEFAPAFRQP
jgi:two-component system, NarL family, response regulator DesR